MKSINRSLMTVMLGGAVVAGVPSLASAQSRDSRQQCRVVYDNLPANRQPGVTDCESAERIARTTGGRVVYIQNGRINDRWDDRRDRGRDRDRDRDRDRWDDRRRDRDGFDRRDYPNQLPRMKWAVEFRRNGKHGNVRRWLGTTDVYPRYSDYNRNGSPERVTWYDSRGRIVQQWVDRDRNGRADRVGIYRNGRLVRVID
ncbi:MAG TPA: hypothetical protein VJ812_03905 [Gemmatimonadaceae bacterium]|jgi:hypothetical protein|nr:hypothetical protein [Gemmatimonadaceae bacterium]